MPTTVWFRKEKTLGNSSRSPSARRALFLRHLLFLTRERESDSAPNIHPSPSQAMNKWQKEEEAEVQPPSNRYPAHKPNPRFQMHAAKIHADAVTPLAVSVRPDWTWENACLPGRYNF